MRLLTVPCGASHTVQIKKSQKRQVQLLPFRRPLQLSSFDALWDPSISKASDFESSYISAKRLKPESSNRQKKKNFYKYSREENTNEVEEKTSLGSSSKTEADNIFNDQLTSAGNTTYVSNKRDVNFGANSAVVLLGLPTSKNESHRQ